MIITRQANRQSYQLQPIVELVCYNSTPAAHSVRLGYIVRLCNTTITPKSRHLLVLLASPTIVVSCAHHYWFANYLLAPTFTFSVIPSSRYLDTIKFIIGSPHGVLGQYVMGRSRIIVQAVPWCEYRNGIKGSRAEFFLNPSNRY